MREDNKTMMTPVKRKLMPGTISFLVYWLLMNKLPPNKGFLKVKSESRLIYIAKRVTEAWPKAWACDKVEPVVGSGSQPNNEGGQGFPSCIEKEKPMRDRIVSWELEWGSNLDMEEVMQIL